MTMKYDIDSLKADLKNTAIACRESKKAVADAQRAFSACPKDATWQERMKLCDGISKARSAAASASLTMTKLCVFRAHLCGRSHLSAGSSLLGFVKEWISDLEIDYAMDEAPMEEVKVDKPAA